MQAVHISSPADVLCFHTFLIVGGETSVHASTVIHYDVLLLDSCELKNKQTKKIGNLLGFMKVQIPKPKDNLRYGFMNVLQCDLCILFTAGNTKLF